MNFDIFFYHSASNAAVNLNVNFHYTFEKSTLNIYKIHLMSSVAYLVQNWYKAFQFRVTMQRKILKMGNNYLLTRTGMII